MKAGDTFKHKGITYKATEVLNKGRIVKGMGEVEVKTTDEKGKEVIEKRPKPITIQVADIDGE